MMEKIAFLRRFGVIRIIAVLIFLLVCFLLFGAESDLPATSVCAIKNITGYDCAGCGATRAAVCLLHFRFRDAFGYNPVVTCLIAPASFLVLLQDIYTVFTRLFGKFRLSATETLYYTCFGGLHPEKERK